MSIQHAPHYRLHSTDLADWLERQGLDIWWSADGDPVLINRIFLPCPAEELVAELRKLNRPLLVEDRRPKPAGHGEPITADGLDALVTYLVAPVSGNGATGTPGHDRILTLAWEGSDNEWMLVEDELTTESSRADAAADQSARK